METIIASMARTVSSPVFVGRRPELETIAAALRAAADGRGTFLLIAGEAGVGKSRLIEEAVAAARSDGAVAGIGRCLELGISGVPFAPIRTALHDVLATTDRPRDESANGKAIEALLPAWELVAPGGDRIGVGPDSSQARAFEACLDVLRRLSGVRPVLLIVEDVHWADPSTLDLLGYLAHGLWQAPIVLAATFRSDELHRRHPLQPFLGEVQRARTTERIDLGRFSHEEVAEQVGAILGEPANADLIERVYKRSDGNAFYAEEIVVAERSGSGLPPAMRDVLLARVATLSDPARDLLRMLAAGGVRVSTAVVARVAGTRPDELDEPLREAVDRHLVVPLEVDGEEVLAFRHALVQEAVYAELLPGERTRLHARYGSALESAQGAREASSPELAYHWFAAHDLPRALGASVEAGRQAAASNAYGDAHGHFERALELWDQVPDAEARTGLDRIGLLVLTAQAAAESDPARAASLMLEAVRSASDEVDRSRFALLKERQGRYAWLAGDGVTAVEACREAAQLVPDDAPLTTQARVLASLGQILMVTLTVGEAKTVCERAVALARAAGDVEVEAHATDSLGVTSVYLGDLETGRALLGRALDLAMGIGSIDEASRALSNLVDILHHSGLLAEAADQTVEAYAFAEQHGLARTSGVIDLTEGAQALYRLGRWDRAEEMLDLELQATSGVPQIMLEERLALLDVGKGRFETADGRLAIARPLTERVVEAQFTCPLAEAAAELALWRGDPRRARIEIAAVLDRLTPFPGHISRLGPLFAMGVRAEADASELARAKRDDRALVESETIARGHLDTIRTFRDAAASSLPNFLSQAEAWLALSEAEFDRLQGQDAPEAWARSAAALGAIPMPYPRAYALWRGAAAMLATSRDRIAAATILGEARAIAFELEARPLLEEIGALVRRARLDVPADHATEPPSPAEALGLTRREREILALIADGRTNREIAEALFITEGTAGTHVSNILGKLGVRGRTEAAAVAHRLGLVDEIPALD
jgi:DNA-binding CsgD family transcriptional regulator/tetratricopeptide (TPR) repeat protein